MAAWAKVGNIRGPAGPAGVVGSLQVATAPASGSTITVADDVTDLIIKGSALAALAVKLPATPASTHAVRIFTQVAITLLTVTANTGQTMSQAYSALLSSGGVSFVYDPTAKVWYRNG